MKHICLSILLGLALVTGAAQARELKPYQGGATPPLALKDIAGNLHKLEDYRGRVILVNFWASWCPPCRAEMPSMERLKEKLAGKPFTILAVDMGETPDVVSAYIKTVHTDFAVLLDSDGHTLKNWKVFAFPTSYVIDATGKIRYALFGSTEWDEADTLQKISDLLPTATP
ncbi:thiol-disulfide oxidoreductase ResA [mine drainage metagenome]|uniref:Thiol-disulfide oxidoreductase ResA n=1 Tax=mine drainage metagenome TaxID=410659 RepID=A0A1J5PMV4_9ZZZZ